MFDLNTDTGLPSESENESSLFMSRFSDEQNFDSFFASEQPKSRKAALSKFSTSIDSVYTQEKKENNLGDKEKVCSVSRNLMFKVTKTF